MTASLGDRNLIITADYGPRKPLPLPFLQSVRTAGIKADIVIIRSRKDPSAEQELMRILPSSRVYVPFRSDVYRILHKCLRETRAGTVLGGILRNAFTLRVPRPLLELAACYVLNITLSRYFIARSILLEAGSRYSAVLLTDSRDVLFQTDPFAEVDGRVITAEENTLIKDEPQNQVWLRQVYGERADLLDRLWPHPVLCSGVTLGSAASMRLYLELMCEEIVRNLPKLVYMPYLDQPIHIKLLRESPKLQPTIANNRDGIIATLATSDLKEFLPDWSSGLRVRQGRLVSIVHQYDRHPALTEALLRRLQLDGEVKSLCAS